MPRTAFIALTLIALTTTASTAHACGIAGSATRTDGSKVDKTARVTTSWNSTTAFPSSGTYTLELGSAACGTRVEAYVNGHSLGSVLVPSSGNARLDIVLKGSTDAPVR